MLSAAEVRPPLGMPAADREFYRAVTEAQFAAMDRARRAVDLLTALYQVGRPDRPPRIVSSRHLAREFRRLADKLDPPPQVHAVDTGRAAA